MQCAVLAGGLGTRMRGHSQSIPKILFEVAGRPFAHWQLSWLASQGVESVLYCIGHLGELVRSYVGDGSRWNLRVEYSNDGDVLVGTGGALRLALERGLLQESFLTLYGDSYLSFNLRAFEAKFYECGLPAMMAVTKNDGRWDRSNAIYADGLVLLYEKGLADQPPEMTWIDYGISAIKTEVVRSLIPAGIASDLSTTFTTLSKAHQLGGFAVDGRFYEIGSVRGLRELGEHLGAEVH